MENWTQGHNQHNRNLNLISLEHNSRTLFDVVFEWFGRIASKIGLNRTVPISKSLIKSCQFPIKDVKSNEKFDQVVSINFWWPFGCSFVLLKNFCDKIYESWTILVWSHETYFLKHIRNLLFLLIRPNIFTSI
jgi:hypothetical protein